MDLVAIEGVRDLVLRYADAINLYDLDQFADVFAEDAVWDVTGYFRGEGRENIRNLFDDTRNKFGWVFQVVHGTRVLELGEGTAKARSYVMEYGRLRDKGYTFLAVYQDHCVLQDGVWRFQHRTCDTLYSGTPDLEVPLRVNPAPRRI